MAVEMALGYLQILSQRGDGWALSFASETKLALCRLEHKKPCCIRAHCYGMWLFSRCFSSPKGEFVTEQLSIARRMTEYAAIAAGITAELSYTVSRRQKPAFRVQIPYASQRTELLSAFGHTGDEVNLRINQDVFQDAGCYAAFLQGAFLVCATVTDPEKEYHLEFSSHFYGLSADLAAMLSALDSLALKPAVTNRKGRFVVYLKESGQIEDFLTYLGATAASMTMMQARMFKETRNDINRRVNFETANMDKTYSAAARQIAAIALINDRMGLSELPHDLQTLATFRLEHPDMSLRELAGTFQMTRSGIDHRLKKLIKIAQGLSGDQDISAFLSP